MTTYATRSPLQVLTNTHYMMAEQPSGNRRSSARLKVKEDIFATNELETSKSKGVTKQAKASGKGGAGTRSKRKIDYDEEDDGFKFSRAQPKRAKAAATTVHHETTKEAQAPVEKVATRRKSRRRSEEPDTQESTDQTQSTTPRRSTRKADAAQQGTSHDIQPPQQRISPRKHRKAEEATAQEPQRSNEQTVPKEPTKIALPFADTPIIRRNKEMRRNNSEARRSSFSMRGRRASSLIDSGTSSALPHDQVETTDFYKHIESSLPEPRRMQQLLMWCGARALGEKPSFATEDSPIKLAARQIQQELLKDFASKSGLSDWFSRDESPTQSKTLRPNPRNLANLAKIEELELKLKSLRSEHEQWTELQKPPAPESFAITPLLEIEKLSLASIPPKSIARLPALARLQSSQHASAAEMVPAIQERLNTITTSFELNLDKLLDSVNGLGQHLASAERISKRVLGNVAKVLDEKDRRVVEKEGSVGTRDMLRALTRVIDRG